MTLSEVVRRLAEEGCDPFCEPPAWAAEAGFVVEVQKTDDGGFARVVYHGENPWLQSIWLL